MKEFSLSLLSRGCGRLISSKRNPGRHDGRLDVCFTPQDYYIWKCQEPLMHWSNSGRLLVQAESTLPKTYSTRRGPLLLYSQDLVSTESKCGSVAGKRNKRAVQHYSEQVEQQLSTLKELTSAILSYRNNQCSYSRLAPSLFPPLHVPPVPNVRFPNLQPASSTPTQPSPELFVQHNPVWLPAEENTEQLENQTEDKEELVNRSRVRLDMFLQITCTSRSPTPHTEPQPWSDGAEHRAQRLPPIAGATARVINTQNQQDVRPRSEKDIVQCRENLNRLHLPPLVLSPLFPEQEEEMSVKQKGQREKNERFYFKKQTAAGGRERLLSEKGATILLEPGHEPPPAVGVSGCVVGRIGPGRQSSLAFLQNRLPDLQNPCWSRDADRGVVRGLLPLELRDLQNGKSVGSLILGPDGEIIQLSLYDNNSQHSSQVDNGTQQQALQVLSTEGETLPWFIVLQSEDTHIDRAVELNTDALLSNVQQHLPKHEGTESHVSVGQFATGKRRIRTRLFQDVHGSTEPNTCPATSSPDTVAVTLKKSKSSVAATGTLTKPKKDGRNNVRITPLREKVGMEEQRGGDAEAEVEEGDEIGQTEHLSPSHRPGQPRKKLHDKEDMFGSEQRINPTAATAEEAVDRRRRNIKKKDTEEAGITTGTSAITTAESEGQKTSRVSRDGGLERQKTRDTSQHIRSQKPEERTIRGTTETHDDSAPPSLKKQMRDDREGKRGPVKKNEGHDRDGGAAARQKEVSTGKKRERRERLTHKELVVESNDDPVEKGEVEINQELEEEESFLKSPKSSSATQEHKTEAKSCEEVETDCLSSNDEQRNIRSVSSLRSSDAASYIRQRNSRGSAASSCGGAMIASATGFSSACGRLSSCSTVMVTEEQLMLNPVKPELPRMSQEEAAALRLAQRAERRRQEVERKRREREEEERRKQEREQTEERMKSELEGERRKRAEELRLKKLTEEEQRRRHEEEEQAKVRREQAKREMERRSQEERRRQMERLQRMREEEERRRKAELEHLQMEEQRRQEEENRKLQEMDESERFEYLRMKEQEEEERRKKEEENKRIEEEAALWGAEQARLQAEQLARLK
ncbi:unnamed protein product [Pleuronectes platessa]|uniref:Uncharacterized protein n=1 Tax=Pleuronectes platessa TaxID=8262 RepID=A0A9N7U117_PLEPL|nr:unnamed protein product [Pleuronectes platessa]